MAKPVVMLDANVFPAVWLLDILLTLDERQVIDAVWSEKILEEVRRALIERRRRTREQADRLLACIASMNPTHCVYGWEGLEPALDLPDKDDRHVLAAALTSDADYIVTYNLKDFPEKDMRRYPVRALHPDELLCTLFERDPDGVMDAMYQIVRNKETPPRTMREELEHLRKLRLNRGSDVVQALA